MNDEKIKQLFDKDHSTPEAPAWEWQQIQQKIQTKKTGFAFFPKLAVGVFAVTLVILGFSVKQNLQLQADEQIGQYLFSDSYFVEEELSFYASEI